SASLVDIPNTTGRLFLKVAFAAISTGESVKACANLLIELPVIGAMTIQSNGCLGPNGSASCIVEITLVFVISSIFSICSSAFPNLLSTFLTVYDTMGITFAPSSIRRCNCGYTKSYVQWDPVNPNPI